MRSALLLTLALAACGGPGAHAPDAGMSADEGGGGGDGNDGGGAAGDLAPGPDMTPPCTTRIDYGSAWIHPSGHSASFDVTDGVVTWDRTCHDDGANSYATLSNGWKPYFTGNGACALTLDYASCGVYANPVIPEGCADPGVVRDGNRWIVACTSGNAANAFPIRVSTDLVHWKSMGAILPSASKPAWAASDFWAPEIHRVGSGWVAYFTARGSDGKLAIGAATAPAATGPFTALAAPLVHDANMGLIDATELEDADGKKYLLWKEDGNAVGKPTPIHGQPLAADGLSLTGSPSTLITNDQTWEGAVVEGPWLVAHGGAYWLFYSGNSYANATYAVGVARATSPLGPYTKAAAPIVTSAGPWVGPGHCSVVDGPAGETVMLYHAWASGHVNGAGDARLMFVDRVAWGGNGWPTVPGAPSVATQPLP